MKASTRPSGKRPNPPARPLDKRELGHVIGGTPSVPIPPPIRIRFR